MAEGLLLILDAFNSRILGNIFRNYPESAFRDRGARSVLVNHLHIFVRKSDNALAKQNYRPDFIAKVKDMMGFLELKRPIITQGQNRATALRHLCRGLRKLVGGENIARAIITTDPNLAPHTPTWWAAFNSSLNISVKLAVAMSVGFETLTRQLVRLLPDDKRQINVVFGAPLNNVIKLDSLHMLEVIIDELSNPPPHTNGQKRYLPYVPQGETAYPVEDAVYTAIYYNRPAMVAALLQFYHDKLHPPSNKTFNQWMRAVVAVGEPALVQVLYASHLPGSFKLDSHTMNDVCSTGYYRIALAILLPLLQSLQHDNTQWDPLNIAVRHRNIDAVRALLETGKVDVNREVKHNAHREFSGRTVTLLDVACSIQDWAMLEFLLEQGANYRRKFALPLAAYAYRLIRAWAMENGCTYLPEYGVYWAKTKEEKIAFSFG
jgi:hypothetical protein